MARKQAAAKGPARKKGAKKAGRKSAAGKKAAQKKAPAKKRAAKKAAKSPAKKRAAKKAAPKKAAAKKVSPRKGARKPNAGASAAAAKKGAAGSRSRTKGSPPAKPSTPARAVRKPIAASIGPRKTARSRLAKTRAGAGAQPPSRKIALRTSLARRSPLAPHGAKSSADAGAQTFDPAALSYREAARQDWPTIRRLLIEAFGRTDESELVERLRASRDLIAEYVADHAGRMVGYVAFCSLNAHIDGRGFRAAGLAPVAVAGEVERRGVATRLTVYGLENIRGLGHSAVFVLGDPAFYGRFGFSARLAMRFDSPWSGPYFQALELEPDALRGERGETAWPEAFASL